MNSFVAVSLFIIQIYLLGACVLSAQDITWFTNDPEYGLNQAMLIFLFKVLLCH